MTAAHRICLGDTGFSVWRDAVLRTAGFEARGLHRFAAPACAAAADADCDNFLDVLRAAQVEATRAALATAADSLFREAVTWQNTTALSALDGLLRGGPDARRNHKGRQREATIARYWQRYCAKNDTVGFFGPVCWVRIDPDQTEAVTMSVGAHLVRRRRTYLEFWALDALAQHLGEDVAIRLWCAPTLHPQLALEADARGSSGRAIVRQPAQPPVGLTPAEAALLAACDGRRRARDILDELVAHGVLRHLEDGILILDRLVERDLLSWGLDVPMAPQAEATLQHHLAAIPDSAARERGLSALARLQAARDRVADCAGDPDALRAAMRRLDHEFVELTGAPPRRREGQMYAGRALCYEETVRDLDASFGAPILAAIAAPLGLLLRAARWWAAAIGEAYRAGLEELYRELRGDGEPVWLGDLWYLAQGMLFGARHRPVDSVAAQFARRWDELFGLTGAADGARGSRLAFRADQLASVIEAVFPARAPAWSLGRLHSTDLHICAADLAAINRGEFTVVLGELHTAWPALDSLALTTEHPDVSVLRDGLRADLGAGRIGLLYPTWWPRLTARTARGLVHDSDRLLGFAAAPGADSDRLLRISATQVRPVDGCLSAVADDGSRWPLLEVFAWPIATQSVDVFKLVEMRMHTPRITVDRLVVARQTWRSTVGDSGLADVVGDEARYRAVRAWRRRLGLPEEVFVKLGGEVKPIYVDLTSPTFAWLLCNDVRGALARGGPRESLTVTEMLPGTDQAWVRDGAGRRYVSELRLHIVDDIGPGDIGLGSTGSRPA